MLGFTGILNLQAQENPSAAASKIKHFLGADSQILSDHDLTIGYKSNEKFKADKVFHADDSGIYGMDGVLLNLSLLKSQFAENSTLNTFKKLYKQQGYALGKVLKGEYCGLVKDYDTGQFMIFSNPTNTKTFFYAYKYGILWFSTDLPTLTNLLKSYNIPLTLHEESAYCLLTYGYMLENYTILKEIKKLRPGNCLKVKENKIKEVSYHEFANVTIKSKTRKEWLSQLEEQFTTALKLAYEKDINYGIPQHLTLISGGLDSRLNTMLAHEKGYINKLNFCFSTKNYWDHTISKQIADYLGETYQLFILDSSYLSNIQENTKLHQGIINYEDSAHFNEALKSLDFSHFGLIHSGQIEDGVLGSLLTAPNNPSPGFSTGANSTTLMPKISSFVSDIVNQYEGEELFLLKNKIFNKVTSGSWVSEQFSYMVSPFMDVHFMETCLAIPPEMKFYERIYIDWLKKYHPDFTRFRWERTKLKPNYKWKTKFGELINMFESGLYKKVLKREDKTTMTPLSYWYNHSSTIQECFENHFKTHYELLDPWPELQQDANHLYSKGSVTEKTQVLTLLEALKKLHYQGG